MKELEQAFRTMDFNYFGTGQHHMMPEGFFTKENIVLLDIRTKEEVSNLKLPLQTMCPVLEIPVNEIPDRVQEIPQDKQIGVFCSGSIRAAMIFAYLKGKGYPTVRILKGGYGAMCDALLPGKLHKKINS